MALDPQDRPPAQAAGLKAPPSHARVAFLFVRALGAIHAIAFASLGVQVEGLVGSRGILPASELLELLRAQTGAERYWLVPTVFWLGASDAALRGVCWLGASLGGLLALGIAPGPLLVALWALYLSLSSVGQAFLGYQWDGLLLETTLLAVLLAPWGLRPRPREPNAPALWLLRFLLFRLMLASGVAKLASGDPTWRSLTALTFHYETQPLPTWVGWYAHQLPPWVQKLSCASMFAVELLVPFLALGPRRARLLGFAPLVGLQLLIAATGNYTFFNLLSIALCLLLLDDAVPWRGSSAPERSPVPRPAAAWAWRAGALVLCLLALVPFVGSFARVPWPGPLVNLYRLVAPFRSFNPYGLFAVMTTERPEILVEGSRDGVEWRPYAFRYKPGDPRRAPAFVAPHQPRLDWQMWFAALRGSCEGAPWFHRFAERLEEGSPPVLALLDGNPFPEGPPARIRARLQDYRFTRWEERERTGAYWRVTDKGLFCPDLPVGAGAPALQE
ncbi:MAG TPA: lipase maturation factor family protein [Vicinamibacteria bacterium]|nr:lipase maturation factor family protein [Vicinamibacteria bacterium]